MELLWLKGYSTGEVNAGKRILEIRHLIHVTDETARLAYKIINHTDGINYTPGNLTYH